MDNEVMVDEVEIFDDEEFEEEGFSKGLIIAGAAGIAAIGIGIVAAVKHFFKKDAQDEDIVEEEEIPISVTVDSVTVQIEEEND